MSRATKSSQPNKKSQQSNAEIDGGWTTKKTRQRKKNLKKPKVDPSKQHKKKSKRRNKKNKLSSNGYNANDSETPTAAVMSVINEIVACYPRFNSKSDQLILQTVVNEMKLKCFNPNDDELIAKMFELINDIRFKDLMTFGNPQMSQTALPKNTTPTPPNETPTNNDAAASPTASTKDLDDEQSVDDIEQKESSESAQMGPKSDDGDDDKKSLSSEPPEEPQRKKRKRRRPRRKRGKSRKEKPESIESSTEPTPPSNPQSSPSQSPSPSPSASASPSPSPPQPQTPKKAKATPTLRDKLNNLQLLNMNSAIQQLNEWINLLRDTNVEDEDAFLFEFVRVEGLEIIVNKIILDLGGSISQNNAKNRLLSQHIITLFDILLTGSREYHEWLFSKMLSLSSKLREVKALKENKALICIICNETKSLIRAQCKKGLNTKKEPHSAHKAAFESASSLLCGGHESSDPIVGILSSLDGELSHLCNLYDGLDHAAGGGVCGSGTVTEQVNKNITVGFTKVKSNLTSEMSAISRKSHRLEEELFSMKSSEEKLNSEQCSALSLIGNNLGAQEKKRLELLSEKKRIESELLTIIGLLSDIENNIMINKERLVSIQESFKPKLSLIFSSMSDRQFEIASLSQKSSILQLLLSISEESYNLLSISRRKQSSVENNKKREAENNYVNCLYSYLDKLVSAKLMVLNRQQQLNQHIESFKRTNETTNKYYGHAPHKPYQQQLEQYREIIAIDVQTNNNISQHIYKNISRAKQKISPSLFRKFVSHLQQEKIGSIVDLSKYKQAALEQQTQTQSMQQQMQPLAQTQPLQLGQSQQSLNMNGHQVLSQQQHVQQQPMSQQQQQQRSKPPITKKKVNQNQNQNPEQQQDVGGGPNVNMNMAMNQNRRPPRPHYAGKRKAPVPNKNRNNLNHPHQRYQQY